MNQYSTISCEQLKEILRLHKLWLEGKDGGVRADLRGADLRGADLRKANLKGADLGEADLQWANLGGANLRGANLQRADLRGADLRGADLRGADLRKADLRGANLGGANLQWANLCGANLQWANLCGADLRGANLDYSCWPLWCGSLEAIVDDAIVGHLLFNVLSLMEAYPTRRKAIELIKKSSPITRHNKSLPTCLLKKKGKPTP